MRMTNAEKQAAYYKRHKVERACAQCGKMFMPSIARKTLCSMECVAKTKEQRVAFERQNKECKPLAVCVCVQCGETYQSKLPNGINNRYCSKACARKAAKRTALVCQECGAEFMGLKGAITCSPTCKAIRGAKAAAVVNTRKRIESESVKRRQESDFRKALCLGLRMWRSGKSESEIAEATGYKSVSGFLCRSKQYKRISRKRMEQSKWRASEIECNAKSATFKKEEHFREYAAKELEKHFPCVMQEVQIPGSRRKIDLIVEDGLFRFGIELKNGNRTARMDQALGQAMVKCTFLGGLAPVVAVPDDIQIDAMFLKASAKLGVIAGTLSQVIQQISLKCCGSSTYTPPQGAFCDILSRT